MLQNFKIHAQVTLPISFTLGVHKYIFVTKVVFSFKKSLISTSQVEIHAAFLLFKFDL